MQASLMRIHRFLAIQSLYPLILSSLLAMGLLGARMIFARIWVGLPKYALEFVPGLGSLWIQFPGAVLA
jgi:hypothetical protein